MPAKSPMPQYWNSAKWDVYRQLQRLNSNVVQPCHPISGCDEKASVDCTIEHLSVVSYCRCGMPFYLLTDAVIDASDTLVSMTASTVEKEILS